MARVRDNICIMYYRLKGTWWVTRASFKNYILYWAGLCLYHVILCKRLEVSRKLCRLRRCLIFHLICLLLNFNVWCYWINVNIDEKHLAPSKSLCIQHFVTLCISPFYYRVSRIKLCESICFAFFSLLTSRMTSTCNYRNQDLDLFVSQNNLSMEFSSIFELIFAPILIGAI